VALAVGVLVLLGLIAFFAIPALTGESDDVATGSESSNEAESVVEDNSFGAEADAEELSDDQSSTAPDDSGATISTAGNDVDCVFDAVDPSLLPADASTLEELYSVTVSREANTAYIEADFTCHPDPIGSDAFTEALRGNLELGTGGLIMVDTREARCVTQHLIDFAPDPYQVLVVGTSQADIDAMRAAMEGCFDVDDVAYLNRETGSGPQAYGDDERFDALFDECSAGDERTCDLLWVGTSEGSEYSALAFDCAGREATGSGLCTPDITLGADGYADITSPGVTKLTEECRTDDATSCDLLAAIAPPGSKVEALGYSCGGRINGTALPDCRTELADG
jgi:hypothetical protein